MILDCKICNLEFKDQPSLIRHVRKTHTEFETYEKYVIHHFYDDILPVCKCGCGTSMKFESHNNPKFYSEYTKNHWPHKKHTEETKQQIKLSLQKSMLDLYGVDNPMKLQKFIDKIAETKQEKYNDSTYNNPEKTKQTNLERYGVEYPQQNLEIKGKSKKTNFEKYNDLTFTSTQEGKLRVKKTKKEKYGDEKYINVELIKKIKLEKYGYECEFSNKEWRKKYISKTSFIETYVCEKIGANPKFIYMGKEYDMIIDQYVIEIDGDYYHSNGLTDLNLSYQLNNIQNDYIKTINLQNTNYTLVRIKSSVLKKFKKDIDLNFILEKQYFQNFKIKPDDIIVSSYEISKFVLRNDINKIETKIKTCLKFLKTFNLLMEFDVIDIHKSIRNIFDMKADLTINNIKKYMLTNC